MQRIGIFGGTFNPVHTCHVRVADDCRTALGLDTILFVPAGEPPLKRGLTRTDLAPAKDRLEMVKLAVAGRPHFAVSDLEVKTPGPSYTIDTIGALKTAYPAAELTFIMGLDALLGIGAWHRPEAVLRACPIAVLFRPGSRFAALRELPLLAGVDFIPIDRSSCEEGDRPVHLASADGIRLTLLPIAPCAVSGTAIRKAIRAGNLTGETVTDGLPAPVADYIIRSRLYV